jgi:acetyl esterase/lipase
MSIVRDVVYGSVIGFRPLALDLRLPDVAGAAPVILFVHGGGWRQGSKAVLCPTISEAESFDRIVATGFAIVSVDYRLSGEAHFPAQVDDVRMALAWVREHADEHHLDASKIILWGESAGATIATLVALEPNAGVAGVIDWYGPSNLLSMAAAQSPEENAGSRETEWLGVRAPDDVALATAASPVFQVHDEAPPFLIAHGLADQFVPFTQSEELATALRDHDVTVDLTMVEGANHLWRDAPDTTSLMTRALAFAAAVTQQQEN